MIKIEKYRQSSEEEDEEETAQEPFPPPRELRNSYGDLMGWVCPLCYTFITYLSTGFLFWKKKIPIECEHMGIGQVDNAVNWHTKNTFRHRVRCGVRI